MRTFDLVTVAVVTLASASCSKKAEPAPVPESSAAAATAPVASAGAAPSASAPPAIAVTLGERLLREAGNRPHIHPNADDVLAAFAKAGGAVTATKQGLAATYKASFCEGGTTIDGVVTMSVCEYPDEDSAKAGLAALQAIYPAKQANHVLRKDTVLTTLRLKDGPSAQALESKLVAVYTAL
jgi:hypothetical protein